MSPAGPVPNWHLQAHLYSTAGALLCTPTHGIYLLKRQVGFALCHYIRAPGRAAPTSNWGKGSWLPTVLLTAGAWSHLRTNQSVALEKLTAAPDITEPPGTVWPTQTSSALMAIQGADRWGTQLSACIPGGWQYTVVLQLGIGSLPCALPRPLVNQSALASDSAGQRQGSVGRMVSKRLLAHNAGQQSWARPHAQPLLQAPEHTRAEVRGGIGATPRRGVADTFACRPSTVPWQTA